MVGVPFESEDEEAIGMVVVRKSVDVVVVVTALVPGTIKVAVDVEVEVDAC